MARTPFDGLAPEIVAMILAEVDFADSTSLLALACTSKGTFTAIAPRLFKRCAYDSTKNQELISLRKPTRYLNLSLDEKWSNMCIVSSWIRRRLWVSRESRWKRRIVKPPPDRSVSRQQT